MGCRSGDVYVSKTQKAGKIKVIKNMKVKGKDKK